MSLLDVSICSYRLRHPAEECPTGHVKRTARVIGEEFTEKERNIRRLTDDVAAWVRLGRHDLARKGWMAIERLRNARPDAGYGPCDSYDLAMRRADRARRRADGG
jgi:hypothetical protein